MEAPLRISIEEIEQKIVLRLEGRLDATSAPHLEKKLNSLIEEKRNTVLLDFQRVEYLSSAGLRLLLSATKKFKSQKGELILFSVGEEAGGIIKMAGFDRILNICSNEKEALQR